MDFLLHELQQLVNDAAQALGGGEAQEGACRSLDKLLHRVAWEMVKLYLLHAPSRMDPTVVSSLPIFPDFGGMGIR